MGFWSTLGSIAGVAAAPFTGGTSMIPGLIAAGAPVAGGLIDKATGGSSPGPSTASAVGQTAGSIEQQRMNALIKEAELQQTQDQQGLNRTNAGVNVGNLNLAQQKQALSAPGQLAGQSVRGDVLANSQDATVSGLPSYIHVGNVSGGLRPSMLSASSRALGGQMSRNALADSTSGKFTTQAPLPTVPGATPLPSAGAFDKVLQGGAIGGSFLDALKGVGNGASSPSGVVPGNINPDNAWTLGNNPDTSNLGETGAGIDPAILELLKQQADPTAGADNG